MKESDAVNRTFTFASFSLFLFNQQPFLLCLTLFAVINKYFSPKAITLLAIERERETERKKANFRIVTER